MEKLVLREIRDIGDSISTTFRFIGRNFKPLLEVFAFYLAAPILILSVIMGIGTMQVTSTLASLIADPTANPDFATDMILKQFTNPLILIGFVLSIIIMTVFTTVIYKAMSLYDANDGIINVPDIKKELAQDSIRVFFGTLILFLFLLIAGACIGLVSSLFGDFSPFVAILLLVAPMIYATIAASLVYPIMIEEKHNVIIAIQRSFSLVFNNWWRTFGFLFLISLILFMVLIVIRMPLSFIFGALLPLIGFENIGISAGITAAFMTAINYVIYLFFYVALGIWYYNLVEQKEGTQLLETLDEIGKEDKPDLDYFR